MGYPGKTVDIDGQKLRTYLHNAGKTMEQLSLEINAGKGYVSKAVSEGRINPVHYKMICITLGVPETLFKRTEEPKPAPEEKPKDSNPEPAQDEVMEMLKRINRNLVVLGHVCQDILTELKGEKYDK